MPAAIGGPRATRAGGRILNAAHIKHARAGRQALHNLIEVAALRRSAAAIAVQGVGIDVVKAPDVGHITKLQQGLVATVAMSATRHIHPKIHTV